MKKIYSFESSDSLAQFTAWLLHIHLAPFTLLPLYGVVGWNGVMAYLLFWGIHIAGLRASIAVTEAGVVIREKWLFVPYRTHRAPEINDVWYGGDWGMEEGAICLVVQLGQKEVCIGTRKNMGELYCALSPLASMNQWMGCAA